MSRITIVTLCAYGIAVLVMVAAITLSDVLLIAVAQWLVGFGVGLSISNRFKRSYDGE